MDNDYNLLSEIIELAIRDVSFLEPCGTALCKPEAAAHSVIRYLHRSGMLIEQKGGTQ